MPVKTEIEKIYDAIISQAVWPHFKCLGYRKKGGNIRFFEETGGFGKIQENPELQKSAYGDRENISFAINLGLYLEDFEHHLRGQRQRPKVNSCWMNSELVCDLPGRRLLEHFRFNRSETRLLGSAAILAACGLEARVPRE
jgi:hypothetical protein